MSHKKPQKARKGTDPERSGKPVTVAVDEQGVAATMAREREELEKTWARPTGLRGWFTDTDHKAIALRYIVTAFIFFLLGGVLLYVGFFLNTGPDAGWFAYVPLSGPAYSPGKRVDICAQMITFTEISALVGAVI